MQYKEGRKRFYQDLEFYACCGFVRVHDNRDGRTRDIPVYKFFERAQGLAASLERKDPDDRVAYQELKKLARLCDEVEEVCKEAAEMGDIFDPAVIEFHRRHKTYRKPFVSVPGTKGMVRGKGGLIVPRRHA